MMAHSAMIAMAPLFKDLLDPVGGREEAEGQKQQEDEADFRSRSLWPQLRGLALLVTNDAEWI
jgi:hypothetical protein